MGLAGLEKRSIIAHKKAFDDDLFTLPIGGFYSYRKGGEKHSFEATSIHMLQSAVGSDSYSLFKKYAELINQNQTINIYYIMALHKKILLRQKN